MRKNVTLYTCLLMMAFLCLALLSCGEKPTEINLWDTAVYTEDTTFGSGAKTISVEVIAAERSVTFTIHSDKTTVGEALLEHKLIDGEQGAYGLYVKTVNGIVADYNINQSYWAFSENGEGLMTGVDGESFSGGEHYELVYTRS